VARGELVADLEVELAVDLLYGAIYYRLLVSHQPLSEDYAHAVLQRALVGMAAPAPA
jgi:hypothetical protein